MKSEETSFGDRRESQWAAQCMCFWGHRLFLARRDTAFLKKARLGCAMFLGFICYFAILKYRHGSVSAGDADASGSVGVSPAACL